MSILLNHHLPSKFSTRRQSVNCIPQMDWLRIGRALACIGKFRANPRQSEDNCASNQGTSLLYGMVPSLLGGRNLSHSVAIPCQLGSNLLQTVHRSQVNPAPFRCQSKVKPGSFQTQHSRSTTIFQ